MRWQHPASVYPLLRQVKSYGALFIGLTVMTCAFSTGLLADDPGRGLTGPFEVNFMELTIDHHFAALRMTELAAGTDPQRQAAISPDEGTSPTPGYSSTPAKASLDDLKSLARRNNRMQREEIMMLQTFLRDWYGINYQPKVRPENQPLINVLEKAQAGDDFNHAFFEAFSRHHFMLMEPVNGCLTGSDVRHQDLLRACTQMWHSQISDIDEMRHELERHYNIVDYQPFPNQQPLRTRPGAPRGQHSGSQP